MIIWGIIALAILVIIHEAGHFVVAKSLGVGVEAFSIGFGPVLLRKQIGETEYRISLIPLGGYVKLIGESPDSDIDKDKEHMSFDKKPIWKRFLIVLAGPVTNVVTAVLFFIVSSWIGIAALSSQIGNVIKNSPAYNAGIRKLDKIVDANGKPIKTFKELAAVSRKNPGKTVKFTIIRDGRKINLNVTPELRKSKDIFGESIMAGFVGVMPSGKRVLVKHSFFSGIADGAYQSYRMTYLTIESLVKLVTGKVSAKQLGGPIMIVKLAGREASAGIGVFLFFLAVISINLGILNLLPVPILDGGHLFFFAVEAVRGKRLSEKTMSISQYVGLSLLLMLMLFATFNDLNRFFPKLGILVSSIF